MKLKDPANASLEPQHYRRERSGMKTPYLGGQYSMWESYVNRLSAELL
ncbi:MAG: hypothetical protein WCH75_22295 [Candidatus Binatia bacterium]